MIYICEKYLSLSWVYVLDSFFFNFLLQLLNFSNAFAVQLKKINKNNSKLFKWQLQLNKVDTRLVSTLVNNC